MGRAVNVLSIIMEGLEINLQESNFRDHIAIYKGSRYIGIIVEFSKDKFTKMSPVFSLKFYNGSLIMQLETYSSTKKGEELNANKTIVFFSKNAKRKAFLYGNVKS